MFSALLMPPLTFYLIWKKEEGKLNAERNAELWEIREKIKTLLQKVLKNGIRKRNFRKTSTSCVAGYILGILDAGVYQSLSNGLTLQDSQEERDSIFDFILNAIKV